MFGLELLNVVKRLLQISFKSVKDVWIPKLRRDGTEKLRVVIVGSKSDLTSLRQVDTQVGITCY